MISVILPAYNAEAYITRAIDSVLAQTFADFELLVINDGSVDDTKHLVERYCDSRIKLIDMPQNVGLIRALNHGLRLASRKYIARMDADDICLPTRFEKQIQFLEENNDYVACGTSIINFNERAESYMQYPQTDSQIRVALSFFERNICHPTVMIRREALLKNKICYRDDYIHAEDYVLWIELSKVGKLHNLKEGLLRYYRHEDQVSAKYYPQQMAISRTIVREQIRAIWPDVHENDIQTILKLCVHEQGVYPDHHFPLKQVNTTIKWILDKNTQTPFFDFKALKKTLYFKKFRCSFYYFYRMNYGVKLWCFIHYLQVEPKRAILEIIALIRILALKNLKEKS